MTKNVTCNGEKVTENVTRCAVRSTGPKSGLNPWVRGAVVRAFYGTRCALVLYMKTLTLYSDDEIAARIRAMLGAAASGKSAREQNEALAARLSVQAYAVSLTGVSR